MAGDLVVAIRRSNLSSQICGSGASPGDGVDGLLCSACREELADLRAACVRMCGWSSWKAQTDQRLPPMPWPRFHFDAAVRLGAYEGFRRSAMLRIKHPKPAETGRFTVSISGDVRAGTPAAMLWTESFRFRCTGRGEYGEA